MTKELDKYFNILCNNDYPEFINKYLTVKELTRLKGIGQFCGCDYTKIYNIKYWYSRYDHSIACALMTWNFTKDKVQTLAALFHDLGTPVFSHSIDFMLGDTINQESSELSVKDVIIASEDIKEILNEDNIDIDSVCDLKRYTIIENKKPKLFVDRLDGVFHTVLIWLNTWSIEQIEEVYKDIVVLYNEDKEQEIGFNSKEKAEKFCDAVHLFSMALQKNENKYILSYIASATKYLIDEKIIEYNDLYKLSEKEIVGKCRENIKSFIMFERATTVINSDKEPQEEYYISLETKKRTVIPLCEVDSKSIRINQISDKVQSYIETYNNFNEPKYCYINNILPFN